MVVLLFATLCTPAFAKDFAPKFDITNLGVQTQYTYSENDVSWLRKLVVKEDMLSVSGIATESVLYPVTDYPYTTDAAHFKAEVEECTKTYTLDEDSQKAAYLYLIKQVGALSIISEPTVSDQTKADWLREQGIVITESDEQDPEKILMISALYAMMRNDLYYVYTGEHLTIPDGTELENAIVMYLAALSGQDSVLAAFINKYFGQHTFGNLEDYMYYTSLMALYTNGYVSAKDIPKLSRSEVYRRVAIMTIRSYGLAIDSEKASTEELQQKYLTAMLGTHYKVTLDPESLVKAKKNNSIAYYILQRMAYEDAKLTLSQTKYSFENCFKTVLQKTERFDLKKEFYSDINEYNVYLDSNRSEIYINPTPLTASSLITINGKTVIGGEYTKVALQNVEHQVLNIVSRYTVNGNTKTSLYKVNVYQGTTPPADSNITGIVPTYQNPGNTNGGSGGSLGSGNGSNGGSGSGLTLPDAAGYISQINGAATNLVGKILSLNDKGQLVDQEGNVISQATYETLPEGYKYVLGDDGVIRAVLIDGTTDVSETGDNAASGTSEKTRKTVIIISTVMCIVLALALVLTLLLTKKNRNKKTADSKTKSRKAKERAKKAKREAREMRKNNKK